MPSFLAAMRSGRAEVWLVLDDRASGGAMSREQQFADQLRRRYPEVKFRDASPLLHAMREIKSTAELALIQRAVDITVAAQKAAMARVVTAAREHEVQATIEFTFRNLGACCWAFPSIVAAGRNATTLHYVTNNDPIVRDGLLLVDIGAEVEGGYGADVTRTYPADGTFSAEQRAIYDAVFAAQNESMPLMRAGRRFIEVHNKSLEVVGRELLKLGLVTKNTPEQAALYLFHGSGHPLGLQTHDVYDRTRAFEPGMVFTNEPGVYVRKDDILGSEVFKKLPAAGAGIDARRGGPLRRHWRPHRRRRADYGRRAEGALRRRAQRGKGHRGCHGGAPTIARNGASYGKIPSSMYDRATLSIALTKAAVRRSGIFGSRRRVSRS